MSDCGIVVVNNADGRKYKMLVRGDLGLVSVSKLKRYLASASGIPETSQVLSFNHKVLADDQTGADLCLYDGAVVSLDVVHTGQTQHEGSRLNPEKDSISRLERLIADQQRQIEELRRGLEHSRAEHDSPSSQVERCLGHLRDRLGLLKPIELDSSNTSVIYVPHSSATLLLTFDPGQHRLYVYSTVLSRIPADPSKRLELYEILLEGSLLGRETCGGSMGLSVKDQLVLMSLSFDLHRCVEGAVADAVPDFLETVTKWSTRLQRSF